MTKEQKAMADAAGYLNAALECRTIESKDALIADALAAIEACVPTPAGPRDLFAAGQPARPLAGVA